MADNLIWLASYPKSGNTWLKIILQEIVAPGGNLMDAIPTATKEVPKNAPLHDVMGTRAKIIKTHCYPTSPRLRDVKDDVIGIISIYRHPLDVLLSTMNFLRFKNEAIRFKGGLVKSVENIVADGEIDHYVNEFIERDGCPAYNSLCGPWSEYQPGWDRKAEGAPYLRICYEDMVAEPRRHIHRIYEFLGLKADEATVDALAVKADKRTAQNGDFFWKRKAFNFTEMLPASSIRMFEKRFETELKALGYPAERYATTSPPSAASR